MKDESPLEIALAATKCLPASNIEECRQLLEVERLVPAHKRRISIADHERWLTTGRPPHEDDADLQDLLTELRSIERHHDS